MKDGSKVSASWEDAMVEAGFAAAVGVQATASATSAASVPEEKSKRKQVEPHAELNQDGSEKGQAKLKMQGFEDNGKVERKDGAGATVIALGPTVRLRMDDDQKVYEIPAQNFMKEWKIKKEEPAEVILPPEKIEDQLKQLQLQKVKTEVMSLVLKLTDDAEKQWKDTLEWVQKPKNIRSRVGFAKGKLKIYPLSPQVAISAKGGHVIGQTADGEDISLQSCLCPYWWVSQTSDEDEANMVAWLNLCFSSNGSNFQLEDFSIYIYIHFKVTMGFLYVQQYWIYLHELILGDRRGQGPEDHEWHRADWAPDEHQARQGRWHAESVQRGTGKGIHWVDRSANA